MMRPPDITAELADARILLVDDEPANVRIVQRLLRRAGYTNVVATTDSKEALLLARTVEPDLVLLDLVMPHPNGHEVLAQLRDMEPARAFMPVLVLTADTTAEARDRALAGGANDFVVKPFDASEVLLRVRNLLEARSMYHAQQDLTDRIAARAGERTISARTTERQLLDCLARIAEAREGDATRGHAVRVGLVAGLLATELGLPAAQAELLRRAAPLHDIGKVGVPDEVLFKPGPLTGPERALARSHTSYGSELLSGRCDVLTLAREVALSHHEWWDGTGYPSGLRGEAIPLAGRIVGAADVFDVLTHDRPYQAAVAPKAALVQVHLLSGRRFDPAVVAALESLAASGTLLEATGT